MYEERRRILEMLASGKITAIEAEELIDALDSSDNKPDDKTTSDNVHEHHGHKHCGDHLSGQRGPSPRFLRIMVAPKEESKNGKLVNIKIPLAVLRAGVKISSMLPEFARDKIDDVFDDAFEGRGLGLNFSNLKPEQIDELIASMREMDINVQDGGDNIRIFCE
jgi:hypothetical protein